MRKMLVVLALLVMVAVLFAGCGGGGTEPAPTDTGNANQDNVVTQDQGAEGQTFTLAELAKFDGKNGQPAYVAVDGVVYDLTGSSLWPEGDHTNCNLDSVAGKDLSEVIQQAPARMRTNLQRFPVVGTLAP